MNLQYHFDITPYVTDTSLQFQYYFIGLHRNLSSLNFAHPHTIDETSITGAEEKGMWDAAILLHG